MTCLMNSGKCELGDNGHGRCDIRYICFVILNCLLFIRPSELIAQLIVLPYYEIAVLVCVIVSLGAMAAEVTDPTRHRHSLSICIVLLIFASIISHLSHGRVALAYFSVIDLLKCVVYYWLMCSIITSGSQLRRFLRLLIIFTAILVVIALLDYHDVVRIEAVHAYQQVEVDPSSGEKHILPRLCSTGIFSDPNDFCLVLTLGVMLCMYEMGSKLCLMSNIIVAGIVITFICALRLTYSRGGLIALLASVSGFLWARFGIIRTAAFGMVALPVVLLAFEGRQIQINTDGGTGRDRILLWKEGLVLFEHSPIFGIGKDEYVENVGLVVHNSFLHSFVELGIIGGTAFIGCFVSALCCLRKSNITTRNICADTEELLRFRPYLVGIVCGYIGGYLTLSRQYSIMTYLIFGLVTVYVRCAFCVEAWRSCEISRSMIARIAAVSLGVLLVLYVFVRMTT